MAARKKGAKKSRAKKSKRTTRKTTGKVKRKTTRGKSKAKSSRTAKSATKAVANTGPLSKVSKMYTKSALLSTLSERTGLSRKEVGAVLTELGVVIEGHVKRGGPGKFAIPGVLKMTVKNVPARKARKGINPFTGEPTIFKAKPASRKVKITALKALKEMAS